MPNIYHYTSIDGADSILKNRRLRFTRAGFLNDPEDCMVLLSIVKEHLKEGIDWGIYDIRGNLNTIQEVYNKAPLMDYLLYLQKKIRLYVLSLTQKDDQMPMWNYYGNNGIQLSLDKEKLIEKLRGNLTGAEQYITYNPVIYVPKDQRANTINLAGLGTFGLTNVDVDKLFSVHANKVPGNRLYEDKPLSILINSFLKGYILSLDFLISRCLIDTETSFTNVFEEVLHNTIYDLPETSDMVFKKDLTLYMVVLSALLKKQTYEYEDEFRIAFFEIEESTRLAPQYGISSVSSKSFIRPYIEFEIDAVSINGLKISPLMRNIPIEDAVYQEVVQSYVESWVDENGDKLYGALNVEWSAHRASW